MSSSTFTSPIFLAKDVTSWYNNTVHGAISISALDTDDTGMKNKLEDPTKGKDPSQAASNDHPWHCCQHVQILCRHNANIYKSKLKSGSFHIHYSGPVPSEEKYNERLKNDWCLPYFHHQSFLDDCRPTNFEPGRYRPLKLRRWFVETLYYQSTTTSDVRRDFSCPEQEWTSSEDFKHFLETNFINRLPPFILCAVKVFQRRAKGKKHGPSSVWIHSRWLRILDKFKHRHSIVDLQHAGLDSNNFFLVEKTILHSNGRVCKFPTEVPLYWFAVRQNLKTTSALRTILHKKNVGHSEFSFITENHFIQPEPPPSIATLQALHAKMHKYNSACRIVAPKRPQYITKILFPRLVQLYEFSWEMLGLQKMQWTNKNQKTC